MSNAIVTMCVGVQAEAWLAVTGPALKAYAEKCGAAVHVVRDVNPHKELSDPHAGLMIAKLDIMHEALEAYDRVLWMDGDTHIAPNAPDIFQVVPSTHWAAHNEGPSSRKYGKTHHTHAEWYSKQVEAQEGQKFPEGWDKWFNCGIQLASKEHHFLYAPPKNPDSGYWVEQMRVTLRIARSGMPIYYLPECWNCMSWFKQPEYWQSAYFVHYCGVEYHNRLPLMHRDRQKWYGFSQQECELERLLCENNWSNMGFMPGHELRYTNKFKSWYVCYRDAEAEYVSVFNAEDEEHDRYVLRDGRLIGKKGRLMRCAA